MRSFSILTLAFALAAAPSAAQPTSSQNPRTGKLVELTFANNSDALTAGEEPLIGKVAGWFEQNPDGHVVLDAHATRIGTRIVNRELSIRRAQMIRDRLVELGVDRDRIVITA
jgi:outer membrane protein OmpA-like peptidoglycan-associated protein